MQTALKSRVLAPICLMSAGSHLFGGTGKVHLRLKPNEHIVGVRETYSNCNASTNEWLWKIQFETTHSDLAACTDEAAYRSFTSGPTLLQADTHSED
jgi:hypothetical protein